MPNLDTLGPPARGKRELEIVAPVRQVGHGRPQRLLEHVLVREQVLGHAEPQPEQRGAADHVLVRHDAQRGPAVDRGEQRQVVVGPQLGVRVGRAEGEGREDLRADERAGPPGE